MIFVDKTVVKYSQRIFEQNFKDFYVKEFTFDEYNKSKNNSKPKIYILDKQRYSFGVNLQNIGISIILGFNQRNPTYDEQILYRTYRRGQKKEVYLYRLVLFYENIVKDTDPDVAKKIIKIDYEFEKFYEKYKEIDKNMSNTLIGFNTNKYKSEFSIDFEIFERSIFMNKIGKAILGDDQKHFIFDLRDEIKNNKLLESYVMQYFNKKFNFDEGEEEEKTKLYTILKDLEFQFKTTINVETTFLGISTIKNEPYTYTQRDMNGEINLRKTLFKIEEKRKNDETIVKNEKLKFIYSDEYIKDDKIYEENKKIYEESEKKGDGNYEAYSNMTVSSWGNFFENEFLRKLFSDQLKKDNYIIFIKNYSAYFNE